MTTLEGGDYNRSSFCSGGSCVEVAALEDGWISVRDTKDRGKPPHMYTREEWADFVRGVKAGEFYFPASNVSAATVRIQL
jgi:hypothetical protein